MSLSEGLEIAIQIGSGLAAAHAIGIIHRDLKPENVMLRADGYVKVLDFGLAKFGKPTAAAEVVTEAPNVKTETGVVMGTSRYMSPEQARGLPVDARTDVWSLGVVLYEMIAACVPFEGDTSGDVIVSILEREPAPLSHHLPEAPAELQRIVTKALSKSREERYQTILEFLLDLKNLKQQLEAGARLERARKRTIRSNRLWGRVVTGKASATKRLIWLAALALIIIVGSGVWFYISRPMPKPSLPPMKVVAFTSFPGWEGNPAFSPDGNRIAFDWSGEKNDNSDICV